KKGGIMRKQRVIFLLGIVFVIVCFFITGCSGVMKATPASGIIVDVGSMNRNDYTILDRVEGTSSTRSFLFGLIQIIDGDVDKIKVFWIPFFEEKYAFQILAPFPLSLFQFATTADRAYYKALAKTPDADSVLNKAYSKEKRGIPFIFENETVTFTGKAIKLKTDNDLGN
ncbi:MAG: hypothetical protein KAH96_03370, partial [Alphaproteobacteria bacterium]|nr:hypothetical protein [Alphaproteobacteria bacterium]